VSAKVELRMLEGSEFQNRGRQRLCGHVEPTEDWRWQNAESVWECDN